MKNSVNVRKKLMTTRTQFILCNVFIYLYLFIYFLVCGERGEEGKEVEDGSGGTEARSGYGKFARNDFRYLPYSHDD